MERRFARSFDALEEIFDFARSFFDRESVGAEHHFALNLAIEEVFTNMVKYHPGNANPILIRLDRSGQLVRVELVDSDVEPFDPTLVEDADVDAPLEQRSAGGLGIHLTRRVVDSIEYEYADRRSTVTLTKRLE